MTRQRTETVFAVKIGCVSLFALLAQFIVAVADSSSVAFSERSLESTIPGTPGKDYPIYSSAPETSFSCQGLENGGYYSDVEAGCQAFHICVDTFKGSMAKLSFLCPNGTIFNQDQFTCDWWFNVRCTDENSKVRNSELAEARKKASNDDDEGPIRRFEARLSNTNL